MGILAVSETNYMAGLAKTTERNVNLLEVE